MTVITSGVTRLDLARRAVIFAGLALIASLVWAQPATGPFPKLPPELEKVRAALDKYQDPVVAIHDGWFSTLGCVEFPTPPPPGRVPYPVGGMGVHFLNPILLGPTLDPLRPQVLVYEPVGEKLRLVAAEWFVPLSTGIKERPKLFGAPFDGPMEGHHPLLPTGLHHYDLHVWLWKENPLGLFKPTNPAVKCASYSYTVKEEAPKIVPHK